VQAKVTKHQEMRRIEPLYTMAILDVLNMINDLSKEMSGEISHA